jgi:hypothetical protein
MRLSHDPLRITASFDDPNLVSRAGLAPVMALAERAGLQATALNFWDVCPLAGDSTGRLLSCM